MSTSYYPSSLPSSLPSEDLGRCIIGYVGCLFIGPFTLFLIVGQVNFVLTFIFASIVSCNFFEMLRREGYYQNQTTDNTVGCIIMLKPINFQIKCVCVLLIILNGLSFSITSLAMFGFAISVVAITIFAIPIFIATFFFAIFPWYAVKVNLGFHRKLCTVLRGVVIPTEVVQAVEVEESGLQLQPWKHQNNDNKIITTQINPLCSPSEEESAQSTDRLLSSSTEKAYK
jgi:hypothetical protein